MLENIMSNWESYLAAGVAFVIFFDRIAKLTPTKKDDGMVSSLYKVLAVLGAKVKDNPGVTIPIGDKQKK